MRTNTWETLRSTPSGEYDFVKPMLLDHLIATGFSALASGLLFESDRDFISIHRGQEKFLESVLTNNAITYTDDKTNRAWTVSYYLESAKHRLAAAQGLAEHYLQDKQRDKIFSLLRLTSTKDVALTRYEWECVHAAMRIVLKILPELKLPALQPKLPY